MEETSEAHMETDVSSTTEDVPEVQEVTNSNGNNDVVEMVVIVEKVSEDDDNSSQQSDSLPKVVDAAVSNALLPSISPKKSPLKPSKSPCKTPETLRSPNKSAQTQSPKNATCPETPILAQTQCEEMVDSSTKNESHSLLQSNNTTPVKSNPVVEPENVTISPNKEQSSSMNSSPNKETEAQKLLPASKTDPQSQKSNPDEKVNDVTESESKGPEVINIQSLLSYPAPYIGEKEIPNDSHIDTSSDVSEKEHNKSISRELKSLINSAKESKIISECTQLTSKTRKSRAPLDTSNTSVNALVEPEKIQDKRRNSDNSQQSNSSEKSDKTTVKRSMRSQNPEFVNKVKQFLNSVTSKVQKESDEGTDEEVIEDTKNKEGKNEKKNESSPLSKRKKVAESVVQEKSAKLRTDPYCWRCHWAIEQAPNEKVHPPMTCTVCPRSYHYKCLSGAERSKINTEKNWVCPECMSVLHAESSETRSPTMKKINLGMLCELLKHAIGRMMDLNGVEPFMQPVDRTMFPDYEKYVVHPMDLSLMKQNISAGLYGSTEAFLADAQWILHNSIIFNTLQSKLTAVARTLVRSCRAEMGEIEACPECYAAAHAHKPTWFTDVCSTPHVLLWAKLKGFPYWPAKGMSVNGAGLVDVRFFGAHDRAWVPAKDCFLYSEKDPNNFRTKRQDILESMREAEQHIRNISRKYGKFVYPPFKTQFDPSKLNEQIKLMIPSFEGELRSPVKKPATDSQNMMKEKRRSHSKSSKGSHNDGDTSEGEEASSVTSRKMADGAVIARVEDESICEKDNTMEVDSPAKEDTPDKQSNRKRRRSDLEEAVITIIESTKEKKKRVEEDNNKLNLKIESHSITSTDNSQDSDITLNYKHTELKSKVILNDKNEPKTKDNEPTSSTPAKEKPQPLAPIKLVISTKSNKPVVVTKPKVKVKPTTNSSVKFRGMRVDNPQSLLKEQFKEDKTKKRRRSSKSNKHLNNSDPGTIAEKHEKRSDNSSKGKAKEPEKSAKAKDDLNKSAPERVLRTTDAIKSVKERLQFDDDTTLAVLAREAKNNVTNSNITGMPTISSVRSLSTTALKTNTTSTKPTTTRKSIEITIEPNSNVTVTPTVTENLRKATEAANKTPNAKTGADQSLVGKVGVRAFARITSPDKPKDDANTVQVEIKTEPLDLDDAERHMEKMDLMNAFKLRPVNPVNLREVRITKGSKVVVTSAPTKKGVGKVECRPRAKKTFPQPRKPDEGRSELNSKNSMVYIPIQPPVTPVPVRGTRLANVSVSDGTTANKPSPISSAPNSVVNTVTTPLINCVVSTNANAITTPTSTTTIIAVPSVAQTPHIGQGANNIVQVAGINQVSNIAQGPNVSQSSSIAQISTVGHIPTTVHTVPLITSVNGQWTFSLQPLMSVGVDTDLPQPMLNGLSDNNPVDGLLTPTSTATVPAGFTGSANPVVLPATPVVVPVSASASAAHTSLAATSTAQAAPNPMLSSAPVTTPNRMTEATVTPGEPPRLMQRPPLHNPLDPRAPPSAVPVPTTAGPLTAKLNQNSVKLMDFFRNLLEESLELIDEPAAQLASMKVKLEQISWKHRQELEELKHNHELTVAEMRSSFEKEKVRIINELRSVAQAELEAAVKVAKSKQWCANCRQEAQFYCCWNTSYCDYPCQRSHWSQHFAVCTQQRAQDGDGKVDCLSAPPESRLQPQPDHIAKSVTPMTTPNLTVAGGKDATRVEQPQKSSSFIMSMEKDASGNSTVKCVGTYKAPNIAPTQMPIIINKQVINNEENSKKVVTSGGYLIVGAANPTAPMVGARRPTTIQYYT